MQDKFNRDSFERAVFCNKKTVAEIKALINAGAIKEDDFLFTLDDVINISAEVANGFWINCSIQKNPGTRWNKENRWRQVKHTIKVAFTFNKDKS